MVISQKRSLRKVTGGRYRAASKKKLSSSGRLPVLTLVGERRVKFISGRGNKKKSVLLACNKVNLLNTKTKKSQLTEITGIAENAANRNFIRRGILTKGAVVSTPLGKARITSRPGQVSTVNAVLVE